MIQILGKVKTLKLLKYRLLVVEEKKRLVVTKANNN